MNAYQIQVNVKTQSEAVAYLEALIEKGNKQLLAVDALVGTVEASGQFCLTSKFRGAKMSEFVGQVVVEGECVYLRGHIQKRASMMKVLYAVIGLNTVLGALMILSGNPLFMLVSPLFIGVPWLNVLAANKGSYLKASLNRLLR